MSEKNYWSEFYSTTNITEKPSSFASFVNDFIQDKDYKSLLDVGCGNGRDSRFFAKDMKVVGIDQAESAVVKNNKLSGNQDKYICGDFTSSTFLKSLDLFDILYSRFTLHSVEKEDSSTFLKTSAELLFNNGLLCIEVRSVNSDMYGKGEPDPNGDPDAWINGHYRRFVRINELELELKEIGYNTLYIEEQSGWAKYKGDDPVLIRVIARITK